MAFKELRVYVVPIRHVTAEDAGDVLRVLGDIRRRHHDRIVVGLDRPSEDRDFLHNLANMHAMTVLQKLQEGTEVQTHFPEFYIPLVTNLRGFKVDGISVRPLDLWSSEGERARSDGMRRTIDAEISRMRESPELTERLPIAREYVRGLNVFTRTRAAKMARDIEMLLHRYDIPIVAVVGFPYGQDLVEAVKATRKEAILEPSVDMDYYKISKGMVLDATWTLGSPYGRLSPMSRLLLARIAIRTELQERRKGRVDLDDLRRISGIGTIEEARQHFAEILRS